MGIFRTTIAISTLFDHGRRLELTDVMVDTGAEYSWIPRALLEELGVRPERIDRFETADGRVIEREVFGGSSCPGRLRNSGSRPRRLSIVAE